tara:strand:- start:1131 stop:1775 length:645 start_codon:yes stop_codon:yes gene_type:complete
MSSLVQIETSQEINISRRKILRAIALSLTATGFSSLNSAWGQHIHEVVDHERKADGTYVPQLLTEHEFKTIRHLAELIIPADTKGPSGAEAGAAEFIDLLCSQNDILANIYKNGVSWIDIYMQRIYKTSFLGASEAQKITLLDQLVKADLNAEEHPKLAPGVVFFNWIRKMSIDAYYTSKVGIKDIGYIGNDTLSDYTVPQKEIDTMIKKTGLA